MKGNLHKLIKLTGMKKEKSFTIDEIYEKLANYCAYQDRCHFDVEKKLNEFNIIPEGRDHIIIQLIRDNFLNESRFTESFVRGKFNQKKWGKRKIASQLKKRNIPEKLIFKHLNSIDEEVYQDTLRYLMNKKIKEFKTPLSYQNKVKINRFLIQKGYEYEVILSVWKELEIENGINS